MEDDWELQAAPATVTPSPEELQGLPPEEVKKALGMSEEEAELWERGAEAMFKEGRFPEDIRQQLSENFADESILENFAGVGGSGEHSNWVNIAVNDTWAVRLSQVPGAAANFINMMRTESEVTDAVMENFLDGKTAWPSAIILSRWLVIQPPPVDVRGKAVVELGAGLGLPSVVAARLGAARVLVQDRAEEPLRQVLETGLEEDVIDRVTTLRCEWKDLGPRILSAKEEVLQSFAEAEVFLGADILFDDGAAAEVAEVLAQLLRRPEQVAHIVDPYKRRHRRAFAKQCRSSGLEVKETEIITWEPEIGERMETEEDWVHNLLTIRRM